MTRRIPLLAGLLGVLLTLAVSAPVSALPTGALSQLGTPFECVGEEEAPVASCGTTVPYGLNFAYQVKVSPDARNAYSVAVKGDLVEYSRDRATGALSVIGCIAAQASPNCSSAGSTLGVQALEGPAAIAFSPDGSDVYVVAQGESTLVELSRDPETGLLSKVGCITAEVTSTECASTSAKGLATPYGVAVSPDGNSVYVASLGEEAIGEFSRDPKTGALTQLPSPNECISGRAGNCVVQNAIGLKEVIGLVVSPDGRDVYAAAGAKSEEGDVAAFERGEEGVLEQLPATAACVSEKLAGCTKATALQGSEDLAISPDGGDVYATSFPTNAIVELERDSLTGALKQLGGAGGCVSSGGFPGCTEVESIGGPLGVAISPGGEDVYVSAARENAEAAFARDTSTGVLTQLEAPFQCVASGGSCPAGSNELAGLEGARRVTVSPDGTNVYLASQNAHAIAELRRAVTPTVTSLTPVTGPAAGGTPVTILGSGFVAPAGVSFGSASASSVVVNSAESISAVAPPGASGERVNVVVSTYAGASAVTGADRFTYAMTSSPPAPVALAASVPTGSFPITTAKVPVPVLARSGNVTPVSGRVLVRLPGSSSFVSLTSIRQIPFGTVIDATHGKVSVTTVGPHGALQTMSFFEGQFKLTQSRSGLVVATLTGGDYSVCPTARERSHVARVSSHRASGKHVVRKLWSEGHGSYSTKGSYAAGVVLGTRWLTEDLCEGTLIRVASDKVAVTNLVNHRRRTVKAGHSYLAKAP